MYAPVYMLSYCYAIQIFNEMILKKSMFSGQHPMDERVHEVSKVHLAKQKHQFGIYTGMDGHSHLGFDLAERDPPSDQLVSVT
jgi:hypothetical protein